MAEIVPERRGDRPAVGEPGYVDARKSTGRRNYSWPFEPGNTMGLRHGAFSARAVEPMARELVEGVLVDRCLLGAARLGRAPRAVA